MAPGVAAALLLPSVPRDVELVWEELSPSSQSASPLRVPLSINGGVISGSSASMVDSSSCLFDGQPFTVSGFFEDAAASVGGGPSFEFVVQCDGGEARIKCTGRVAVEHEFRATADLDFQALRLRGTRTLIDTAHGIFVFQGPFTLRISNVPSALPSSILSHKRKTALSGTATPTGSPSPRPSAAAKQQSVLQVGAEPECTAAITEVEEAAAIEAQVQAEEESRAKADAEAAAAAEAAVRAERAAEADRVKAEAELVASAKARATSTPSASSAGRAQRPDDALAAQHEESMRVKAVADAKAAALAVDREHEEQQHQEALAAQRKAALEAESLRRREAMQAEAQRLRALADESQAQLERSRASRLAVIEATRAAIAAARMEEETSGRNPQAIADAERRKAASQAKRAGQRSLPEWDEDAEDVDIGSFDQRVGPTHHAGVAVFHRPTAADLAAAAAAEEARQMLPVRLRAPPPPLFDYLKNHTETGILPHVFDLLAVAAPPPLSVDYALRDVLQASAASAQPLTPGALLPLTLLFGPEGLPEAAYHTDTHGCIRRNEWSTLDPRAIFLKFERNVTLQRAALAAAVATSGGSQAASSTAAAFKGGQPEEELSAVLLVLDGTLPTLALSLLDVGVLLKNGLGAVRSIPAAYSNTSQGFLVQTMVFPSMQTSTATSTSGAPTVGANGSKSALHVPHLSVYRVDFSSAHHLEVEKRTNRYALYAPSVLPGHSQGSSGSSAVTPHMRVATFKSPEVERLIHSEMLSGRGSESVANRETFALLRRICVAILKRVNDKCRAEEGADTNICTRGDGYDIDAGRLAHLSFVSELSPGSLSAQWWCSVSASTSPWSCPGPFTSSTAIASTCACRTTRLQLRTSTSIKISLISMEARLPKSARRCDRSLPPTRLRRCAVPHRPKSHSNQAHARGSSEKRIALSTLQGPPVSIFFIFRSSPPHPCSSFFLYIEIFPLPSFELPFVIVFFQFPKKTNAFC